jgi:hypothetical protein
MSIVSLAYAWNHLHGSAVEPYLMAIGAILPLPSVYLARNTSGAMSTPQILILKSSLGQIMHGARGAR